MSDYAVRFKDVWSKYRIKFIEDKRITWEDIWALKNISFEIAPSETICILGENGSGKTTLLKLIAGLIKNEKGELDVRGSVSALLEIGAGFHPELTGRENIYLNASLFGLSKAQVEERLDKIIEFAELGKFINAPVKNYSQGMFVRLGFSVAIHLDPDILLIDDSLAVGDISFQRKCIKKILEFHESGKTLVLVTHDIELAKRLSKRGLMLSGGNLLKDCSIGDAISFYMKLMENRKHLEVASKEEVFISKNGYSVIAGQKRVCIIYKDIELTAFSGINNRFFYDGVEYETSKAIWEITKLNAVKIKFQINWSDCPFSQMWYFELLEGSKLYIELRFILNEALKIENITTEFLISNLYKKWFTEKESGSFSSQDRVGNIAPVKLLYNKSRILGISSSGEEISGPPTLKLFCLNHNPVLSTMCRLFRDSKETVMFSILNIDTEPNKNLEKGEFLFNKFELVFQNNDEDSKTLLSSTGFRREIPSIELTKGELKLIFDDGKGKLFYKNIEITKSLSIFTSIYSSGIWYDSAQAVWKQLSLLADVLEVEGIWPRLPLIQNWKFLFEDGKSLLWEIRSRVYKNFNAEREQFNIMLSDQFTDWEVQEETKGIFHNNFSSQYDIISYRLWSGRPIHSKIKIFSRQTNLPDIIVKFPYLAEDFWAIVENSNDVSQSRVIQAQRIHKSNRSDNEEHLAGFFQIRFLLET